MANKMIRLIWRECWCGCGSDTSNRRYFVEGHPRRKTFSTPHALGEANAKSVRRRVADGDVGPAGLGRMLTEI